MSWESTAEYYRLINERVKERLGGFHSAELVLFSVDFAEIEELQRRGDWSRAVELMVEAGRSVKGGGADFLVICTNTMHRTAADVEEHVGLPVLHIADATAAAIRAARMNRVGLLGTRYTMEHDFYRGRLESVHELEVLIPGEPDRTVVHDIIYEELVMGVIREDSRLRFLEIMDGLVGRGAQGIVLGCTEIGLLIGPEHSGHLLFDTARIHAVAAADRAIGG